MIHSFIVPKPQIQGKFNLFELVPFFAIHHPAHLLLFTSARNEISTEFANMFAP
jgi:hypothetical protein